jgi:hypothetical protein
MLLPYSKAYSPHGLHGFFALQGFFEAQGFFAPQGFFSPHGLQAFFTPHGLASFAFPASILIDTVTSSPTIAAGSVQLLTP